MCVSFMLDLSPLLELLDSTKYERSSSADNICISRGKHDKILYINGVCVYLGGVCGTSGMITRCSAPRREGGCYDNNALEKVVYMWCVFCGRQTTKVGKIIRAGVFKGCQRDAMI